MDSVLQDVLTAAAQLGAFWLVIKAELRAIWRSHAALEKRLDKVEGRVFPIGG